MLALGRLKLEPGPDHHKLLLCKYVFPQFILGFVCVENGAKHEAPGHKALTKLYRSTILIQLSAMHVCKGVTFPW